MTAPLTRREINRRAQAVRRMVLKRLQLEQPQTYERWIIEAYAELDAAEGRP